MTSKYAAFFKVDQRSRVICSSRQHAITLATATRHHHEADVTGTAAEGSHIEADFLLNGRQT